VVAKQINYRGQIEFLNNKSEAYTCIEAFSDNKKKITKLTKTLTKRTLKNAAKNDRKMRKCNRTTID
jgi:hypothetical protein